MNVIAIVELVFATLVLAMLLSFRYESKISQFELERLAKDDKSYKKQLRFLTIYPGLRILINILALIIMIIISAITMFAWGFFGALLAFAMIILAFFISRALQKIVTELIEKNLAWFNKYFAWAEALGKITIAMDAPKINSKPELAHLIEAGDFMDMADKMLLLGALDFTNLKVGDVMIKKADIISLKSSDIIGPKLLDELHQSGHMVFPVMEAKNIVGMLHIEDVMSFDQGDKSVKSIMRRVPITIHETASLRDALSDMKADHSYQLLVVDDSDKLVGMIDMCDISGVLLK